MKVVFISNYYNHHQAPFCLNMFKLLGENFIFIATEKIPEERLNLGYKQLNEKFVLHAYYSKANHNKAKKLVDDADVVIIGSASDEYIIQRILEKKLTFRYSERFYKQELNWCNFLRRFIGAWFHHGRFQKYPLYMLCASAFTAADAAKFGNYLNKTFKWGYFPESKYYNINQLMSEKISVFSKELKHPDVSILWVGRFIELKHPEMAIKLASSLKKQGYQFKLSIIGNGELENHLQKMIIKNELSDYVNMLGSMSSEEVRKHMEKADIYLFTSDFNEGWGAVLNESMNSGCAVVASHAIGSVPFLIKDGENGLIYENGNMIDFEYKVRKLLENDEYRQAIGVNAYHTIVDLWNAEVAANRFIELAKVLLQGKSAHNLFKNGPCSHAEIINNEWYHAE